MGTSPIVARQGGGGEVRLRIRKAQRPDVSSRPNVVVDSAGSVRSPRTMRQRPVVIIALSLLLIAGATVFQLRGQIHHVPGPISGSEPLSGVSTWNCLSGWLSAYQSSKLYYPTNHPALPPTVTKPTRCYRTEAEAKSAGYKLAPPPKGGAVLDGVYLVPTSNFVKAGCEAMSAELHGPIPCPTMLPLEVADGYCSPISRCIEIDSFVAVIGLATPPDFPGASVTQEPVTRGSPTFTNGPHFSLFLWGAPLSSTFGQQLNQCSRGNFGPTVMGRPTLRATCNIPAGSPTAWLAWTVDNWIYEIGSFPPQATETPRMIQFFASKLVAVSPTEG
jgi:hypothetical protein